MTKSAAIGRTREAAAPDCAKRAPRFTLRREADSGLPPQTSGVSSRSNAAVRRSRRSQCVGDPSFV